MTLEGSTFVVGPHEQLAAHDVEQHELLVVDGHADVAERDVIALDRDHERERDDPEGPFDLPHRAGEARARAIELVHEREPRERTSIRHAPHGLRLRLHAGDAVEHDDRAVEDAQRAHDLHAEVDVARRVDEMERVIAPLAAHGGRGDGDALLLLGLLVVERGGPVVDLAGLSDAAGEHEDAFGEGGLAGVDVSDDAEVAYPLDVVSKGHENRPASCGRAAREPSDRDPP